MIRSWTPEDDVKPSQPGYKVVKAWFQRCRDDAKAVEKQRAKIEQLKNRVTKTTPSMTGMPMGSGAGDKVGIGSGEIVDEERKLQQMKTDLCNLHIEAIRRAYSLTTSVECANAIVAFYVEGKTQEKIVAETGLSGADVVRTRINRGCAMLAEIWDELDAVQTVQNPQKEAVVFGSPKHSRKRV